MKKFCLILSGCGQHDGSETHEVVLTLLAMKQEEIAFEAFAPDIEQTNVVNHITEASGCNESRSVLAESARLVRGKIKPITEANISEYDAIVFPGGVGAVNILCNWIEKQKDFDFNPEVHQIITDAVKQKKPMGFICIAPMMIPKIFKNAKLTIGHDKDLALQINEMGSTHIDCSANDVVIDYDNKLVSTPANMVANGIDEVFCGIKKLIIELKTMCN